MGRDIIGKKKFTWRSAYIPKVRHTATEALIFSSHTSVDHSVQKCNYKSHQCILETPKLGVSQELSKETSMCQGSEARENIQCSLYGQAVHHELCSVVPGLRSGCDSEQDARMGSVLAFVDKMG